MITLKFNKKSIDEFASSEEGRFIIKELEKLNINEIKNLIGTLPKQGKIIGLSVLREAEFSLIMVIMPIGMRFDWHNHPDMLGNTRCVFGRFRVTALDPIYLTKEESPDPNFVSKIFTYPKDKMRVEII